MLGLELINGSLLIACDYIDIILDNIHRLIKNKLKTGS